MQLRLCFVFNHGSEIITFEVVTFPEAIDAKLQSSGSFKPVFKNTEVH